YCDKPLKWIAVQKFDYHRKRIPQRLEVQIEHNPTKIDSFVQENVEPGQRDVVMRRDANDAIAITGQTISETSTVRQPQYASTSLPACRTFLAVATG
ncbi:unnamed protein product, partial [Heterotrigona itama]